MVDNKQIIDALPNDNGQSIGEIIPDDATSLALGKYAFYETQKEAAEKAEQAIQSHDTNPEEEAEAYKRAEDFRKRYARILSFFAKDSSLNFVISNDSTFSFNAETFTVSVPYEWFVDEQYSEDELLFSNLHELAHFIDMRKNPKEFLHNFEKMSQDAESIADSYMASHPKTRIKRDLLASRLAGELHLLYNCLDDIYVNNLVMQKDDRFGKYDGRPSVTSLYQKLGYEDPDQTEQPPHRQMAFSLLRDEMIGDTNGESILDDEVEKILSAKSAGKPLRDVILERVKPIGGIPEDPAKRYKFIREIVQPKFVKLMLEWLERAEDEFKDLPPPQIQNGNGSGELDKGFDPFDDADETMPKDMHDGDWDEEETRKILDGFIEKDKIKNMSDEERAKYNDKKRKQKFDKEHNITPEQRKVNDEIVEKNRDAIVEMREFWKNLVGKSIEYRRAKVHNQVRGKINIDSYIKKYPEAVSSEQSGSLRKLAIRDRYDLERNIVDQPEQIDITLLVDRSASMYSGNKVEAARKAAALLLYSIQDFNDYLEVTRNTTKTKLFADTQVISFDSDSSEIKPFSRRPHQQYEHIKALEEQEDGQYSEEAYFIKSISHIDAEGGSTDDATPLEDIKNSISAEDLVRIKNKKLKKIIFEITDGLPDDIEGTKARIRELAAEGVLMVGFQIGDASPEERAYFEQAWNGNPSENVKGIFVGADINQLPAKLMESLKDALGNIVL